MAEQNQHLFTLGASIEGAPLALAPATLREIGAFEVRDLERWVKATPELLGDELFVVTSQFSDTEHFRHRLDVLALDRSCRLVVIELKRDDSGRLVELQAIKYAAWISKLTGDEVIEAHRAWRVSSGVATTLAESRERLADWVAAANEADPLGALDDEDVRPRIILVAGSYRQDVTATVLFLRSFGIDISCVQLTPYQVGGELVLLSQVLIPLPEARDYEARSTAKRRISQQRQSARQLTPAQREAVAAFIAAIPEGRWTSFGGVGFVVTGRQGGGGGIAGHLKTRSGEVYPNVYRVLNRRGEVSQSWAPFSPDLPPTAEAVQARLEREGVTFVDATASLAQIYTAEEWLAGRSDS